MFSEIKYFLLSNAKNLPGWLSKLLYSYNLKEKQAQISYQNFCLSSPPVDILSGGNSLQKLKNTMLTSEQNMHDFGEHVFKSFPSEALPFFVLHFSGMQSFGNSQKKAFCLLQFSSFHLKLSLPKLHWSKLRVRFLWSIKILGYILWELDAFGAAETEWICYLLGYWLVVLVPKVGAAWISQHVGAARPNIWHYYVPCWNWKKRCISEVNK